MANNYYCDGDIIDIVADSDIKSGELVIKGNIIGVAITDINSGETGAIQRTGVWKLAKNGTDTFSAGDVAYYDATNKVITSTSTNNKAVGVIVKAVLSTDTTAFVLINSNQMNITINNITQTGSGNG